MELGDRADTNASRLDVAHAFSSRPRGALDVGRSSTDSAGGKHSAEEHHLDGLPVSGWPRLLCGSPAVALDSRMNQDWRAECPPLLFKWSLCRPASLFDR